MAAHLEYKYVSSATSCRLKLGTQEQRFVLASEARLSSSFSSPHHSREPKWTNGRSSWSSLSGGTKKATPVREQKQTHTTKSQWRMPWRKSNRIRSEEFRRAASDAAGLSGKGNKYSNPWLHMHMEICICLRGYMADQKKDCFSSLQFIQIIAIITWQIAAFSDF